MKIIIVLTITLGALWASSILQNMALFLLSLSIFIVLIVLNISWNETLKKSKRFFSSNFSFSSSSKTHNKSKIKMVSNNKLLFLLEPILKKSIVIAIQNRICHDIMDKVPITGKTCNARILALHSIALMITTCFVLVPISIILGILIDSNLFFLGFLFPVWLFYPKIKLWFMISERKSSISDEIAFFALYASVMQSVGQSVYNSIIEVMNSDIFPSIKNEALMLSRNTVVFGMDPLSALNEHGYSHPNSSFRDFLLGYVSISKSGGNLSLYMEKKTDEFFEKTHFKFKSYSAKANLIGEAMLILLTILPTMILVSSFLLSKSAVSVVAGLALIFIPAASIFIFLAISRSQPKLKNTIRFDVRSVPLSVIAIIVSVYMQQEFWFVIAVGVSIGATANFAFCFKQFREISLTESAIVDFFRDITEFRKIGITIPNAIIKIVEERRYNKHFDQLLLLIAHQLEHGISFLDVLNSTTIRSWFARVSFFVLGKISESGGGSPEILERVTALFTKINQTKKETRSSVAPIAYFATVSPIMMSYTTKEMREILEKLNATVDQMSQTTINIGSLLTTSELVETINLLNIISSISLGLIMSKLVYFSLRHTLFLCLMSATSVLSILISPFLPSLLGI
ncbi:MAG TPA: type II secretion system F family protein [Candidatus Nitrosotenuis sp.]|nr:type II secretion system F family protein [Candidatus Nitrosotenuis sp.]